MSTPEMSTPEESEVQGSDFVAKTPEQALAELGDQSSGKMPVGESVSSTEIASAKDRVHRVIVGQRDGQPIYRELNDEEFRVLRESQGIYDTPPKTQSPPMNEVGARHAMLQMQRANGTYKPRRGGL